MMMHQLLSLCHLILCCACCRWAQQLGGIRALPPLNATGFPVQGESMAPEAVPDIRREARPQHILESLRGILLAASNR